MSSYFTLVGEDGQPWYRNGGVWLWGVGSDWLASKYSELASQLECLPWSFVLELGLPVFSSVWWQCYYYCIMLCTCNYLKCLHCMT